MSDVVHFRKASPRMLPTEEIAKIKAEIERLEQLHKECTDSGIRERIEAWIKVERTKLESDPSKR
jgi:hypothetical protein